MSQASSNFSDELADRWDEYVDCKSRLTVEAPFLRSILEACKLGIVVDAAMGLGCEVIYLKQHGFNVIGNEIDARMRAQAIQRIQSVNQHVQITTVDWRMFLSHFKEQSLDAVLILGNSLCLVNDSGDRKSVFDQIYKSLKQGGIFIVDQRNFDYMFENKEEILAGNFEYSSRFMYCQRGIVGRPTEIEPSRVRISCFDKKDNRHLGYFDVHPFRGDELFQLAKAVGFKTIDVYYDFGKESRNHWDFATFVCHK